MDQSIQSGFRRTKTIHALQCARGFAALLVVYYHASIIAVPSLTTAWMGPTFTERPETHDMHLPVLGACGVDLFFVLSGYIIWTSTQPAVSAQVFYKRRIARIVPLYWLVTLVTALTLLAMPSVFHTLRFSLPHVAASFAFVPWQNPAFPTTNAGAWTPLVVAGWTLNFEMMFYLLFGLVAPRPHHRLRTMMLVFLAAVTLIVLLRSWLPLLQFYDPFLVAEFLTGCLVAVCVERVRPCSKRATLAIGTLGTAALLIGDYMSPPMSRLFYAGLPAAALVYGLATLEREHSWPRMIGLERIGDASYSIYLTHVFVLAAMRVAWRPFAGALANTLPQAFFAASIIATSVIIGMASYRFVERPLSRAAERLLGLRRRALVHTPNDDVTTRGPLALRPL